MQRGADVQGDRKATQKVFFSHFENKNKHTSKSSYCFNVMKSIKDCSIADWCISPRKDGCWYITVGATTTSHSPFKFSMRTNTLPTCFTRCRALLTYCERHFKQSHRFRFHLFETVLCNVSIMHQSFPLAPSTTPGSTITPHGTRCRIHCDARMHTPRSQRPADSAALVSKRLVSGSLNSACAADGSLLSERGTQLSLRLEINERWKLPRYRGKKKRVV